MKLENRSYSLHEVVEILKLNPKEIQEELEKLELQDKLKTHYLEHKRMENFYRGSEMDRSEAIQDGFSRGYTAGVEMVFKTFKINTDFLK